MPVLNPINWSSLNNGQSVAFNPATDQLVFDSGTITAASISGLGFIDPAASPFTLMVDGKTVTLQAALASLTVANVTFASGGLFLVGDDAAGTAGDAFANTLAGGTGNDYLVGLGGNDTLNGGAGVDVVAYRGGSSGYGFSLIGGNLALTDIDAGNGDDGTDTLREVERVRFGDALVTVVPGSELQVNSTTANDQSQSSVAGLADGGFVVAWTSSLQDGSGTGVYAQRYDAGGFAQGSEFRVNGTTANDQSRPSVTALDGGGFVVAWTSNGQDGSGEGVHAQAFDAAGAERGVELRVNSFTTNNQFDPSIAALAGGGFVVAWTSSDQDGGGNGVYAQRYNSLGFAQGTEFRVTTTTVTTQEQPSVTALSGGGFAVAWASNGQDGSGYGVMLRRYDVGGVAQGSELFINSASTGNQWQPSVAPLPGGGFVLAWSSEGQDGSGYGVYARRLDANSVFQGAEFRVNGTTTNSQSQPVVAALAGGGFVVAWTSDSQDGNLDGVYARRYDAAAVAQGGEFLVNSFTTNSQFDPSVTALADGGFVVAWTSNGQDGSSTGVHAQRYDAVGQRVGASLIGDGGANTLRWTGSDGVPLLEGGAGNDTLLGGTGVDVAAFRGTSSGYVFSRAGDSVGVADIDIGNGDEGTDRLTGIEAMRFGDGQVTVVAEAEFRVNGTVAGIQQAPSITGLGGGGFVVTWTSAGQDGSSNGVYAQRYHASGVAQGSEFRVNTYTTGSQNEHAVAALSGGGFVVSWSSSGQDGSLEGVYAQRYDAHGVAQGTEFRVNTYTTDYQAESSIAALDGDGFVVAWTSGAQDGSGSGVYAQRYGAGGVAQGSEFRLSTTTANSQYEPSVAALGGGGFVVAWSSDVQDGGGYGVYAQRYDSSGVAQGAEFRANTTTANDQYEPSVAALGGGGFVVAWTSDGQDGDFKGVYAQRYDAGGVAQGAEFRVNTYTTNDQYAPAVTALSGGGFVVVWTSTGQDGSNQGVHAQRYDASGVAQGAEFRVNTYTDNGQNAPVLTATSGGGFVVAWASTGQDGSDDGVYAQRYDASGDPVGTTRLTGQGAANTLRWSGSEAAWLEGAAGNDLLLGALAADRLDGGNDSDTLDGGAGADLMTGGSGDDLFYVDNVADVVNEAVGGGAADTVLASVSYALQAGTNGEIENMILTGNAVDATGNEYPNTIVGNGSDNTIRGGGGYDTLGGGDGNDTLYGDAGEEQLYGERGDDVILGGDGYDLIFGGEGNDLIVGQGSGDIVFAQSGNDLVDGGAGTDVLFGQEDNDIIFGDAADDQIVGAAGDDIIMGERGGVTLTGGNDYLYGDTEVLSLVGGNDLLDGDGGNDYIVGGGGNDVIDGDHGNDIIEGNAGADILVGSDSSLAGAATNGSDLFIYRAMTDAGDSIYGFDIRVGNNDGIHLGPLFDALGYAGNTPRADGFLRISQSGANALVEIDADGSANGASFTTLVTLIDRTAGDITDSYFLF